MKVTLINTSDAGGGAPAACMRLLKALELKQVDVHMLVQEKKTGEPRVDSISDNLAGKLKARFSFFYERLPFIWLEAKAREVRFAFSTAEFGTDIKKEPGIQSADLLHLHWTNSGFLSTHNIKQLFETGKPVVWTLHDMWAFTGGCHYSGDCFHFMNQCGNCWMLRDPHKNDLSHKGWNRKSDMFQPAKKLVLVTCSHWLADVARTSSLLKDFRIETIPNPIDTELFSPQDKNAARLKWNIDPKSKIILFGAANILDRRKGITYLVEALNDLKNNYSDTDTVEIVLFGKNKSFDVSLLPFKVYEMNVITSQEDMAALYNLADVYVTPAIEDNLPNTVMESLACGTPVVAFNTGGLPDMVDHQQNGYLAEFKSAADFAAGINFILTSNKKAELSANARKKVMENFTNEIVASKYMDVYRSIVKK
ncbi:glycosyltransferase family 4 protein [Mucilaginibacter gotjawali]|uniref:Glycosyltransferase involved in cell wall biosynthesis n=2 Tax=Mucilaginibacter gotjawali TaxID=1550579 RepID=A0A839SAU3_9SPHI|nr:glycosyltransferase family 4 protein [Mucilaginibacter gotjawali]MBB3055195.1 glycosyltransferase involved in cell wall biosynthesis [Mucilaginibacter gotjawali]BAU56186.1 Spore coat protein SA [Mucilaginibacter gotjawali]